MRSKGNVTPAGKDEPSAAQVLAELTAYHQEMLDKTRKNTVSIVDLAIAIGSNRSMVGKIARRIGVTRRYLPRGGTLAAFISVEDAKRVVQFMATREK